MTIRYPLLFALIWTAVAAHAVTITLPDRAEILVVGGEDAKGLCATTGAGGMLGRAVRSGEPRRRWSFTYARGSAGPLAEAHAAILAAVDKTSPDAILLQVGFDDAWDPATERQVTDSSAYQASLTTLVATLAQYDLPIIVGTPLLMGELPAPSNPADAALDAIATANRAVANTAGLPLVDGRQLLTSWLASNNPRQRSSGVLTRNGHKLNRDGWELLVPALSQALGVSAASATGSSSANGGSGSRGLAAVPANTTAIIVGDSSVIKGTVTGGRYKGWWKQLRDLRAGQWADHHVTIYPRLKNSGAELFATAQLLASNVDQLVAMAPSRVVLAYGFLGADPVIGERQADQLGDVTSELAGMAEAAQALRNANIEVVILGPTGGRDDARRQRSTETASALAAIAAQTGSHYIDCANQQAAFGAPPAERDRIAWHRVIGASMAIGLGLDPSGAVGNGGDGS